MSYWDEVTAYVKGLGWKVKRRGRTQPKIVLTRRHPTRGVRLVLMPPAVTDDVAWLVASVVHEAESVLRSRGPVAMWDEIGGIVQDHLAAWQLASS